MATPVLRATLGVDEQKDMLEHLVLHEVVKEIRKNGRLVPAHAPRPPTIFYRAMGSVVEVPYHYARSRGLGRWSKDPAVVEAHTAFRRRAVAGLFPGRVFPSDDDPTAPLSPGAVFKGNLRAYQDPVMEQAREQLSAHGSTTLAVYPGFGKTACGAYLTIERGKRAVVIAHSEFLLEQWLKTFQDFTTLKIQLWTSKTAKKPFNPDYDVLLVMDTCVEKIPPPERARIGTLIMDEAHRLCTEARVPLFFEFAWVSSIVMCTATPERPDGMHAMLHRCAGEHGILRSNPVEFDLVRVKTPFSVEMPEGVESASGSFWTTAQRSLALNPLRNAFIADLVAGKLADRKVLVLTSLTDHVKALLLLLGEKEKVASLYENQNRYDDARVLVGTLSKISVGFDPNGACRNWDGRPFDALVLCTSIASIAPLIQTLGRAFRSQHPVVYYLVDDCGMIDKHWRLASTYAKENHGTVVQFGALDSKYQKTEA